MSGLLKLESNGLLENKYKCKQVKSKCQSLESRHYLVRFCEQFVARFGFWLTKGLLLVGQTKIGLSNWERNEGSDFNDKSVRLTAPLLNKLVLSPFILQRFRFNGLKRVTH